MSKRRVDGVEDVASIQHERAIKFDFHTDGTKFPRLPVEVAAQVVAFAFHTGYY